MVSDDKKERVEKASKSSEKLCDYEDNYKASKRIGDTQSAKHWAGHFANEMFKGDK